MSRIDQLLASYKRHVALPLRLNLPISQRVWFLVYPPEEERRLANRLGAFELITREAELYWCRADLSGAFADWIDTYEVEERDRILADSELVESYASPGFTDFVVQRLTKAALAVPTNRADRTVFAATGLMELYDFIHVSTVVDALGRHFPGILLVFFPGAREGNTYRFLDARTGWDYLAVPILAES